MKKIAVAVLSIGLTLAAVPASAQDVVLESDPRQWRLQNYVPGGVVAYFTGSPCQYGRLSFPNEATKEDKDRFISMTLTAAATGRRMGVYYNATTCEISSFFVVAG